MGRRRASERDGLPQLLLQLLVASEAQARPRARVAAVGADLDFQQLADQAAQLLDASGGENWPSVLLQEKFLRGIPFKNNGMKFFLGRAK